MSDKDSVSSFVEEFFDNQKNKPVPLVHALDKIKDKFGFQHVTYYGIAIPAVNERSEVLHTTYEDCWISRYFENQYGNIDPVVKYGSKSLVPIDWTQLVSGSERFFEEASEFGISSTGVTVPVHGPRGETGLFSVNADLPLKQWQFFLSSFLADLTYSAHLLHDAACEELWQDQRRDFPCLTTRERSVLEWAARGKTAWETGQILGLKEKTVSFYLGNACTKLKVSNKTQAVAQSVTLRMIEP